jgi:adenine-specific DNA-methyltransferase
MKKNVEDGGKRKYVMVQLPEESDKKSIAYKAATKTFVKLEGAYPSCSKEDCRRKS